MRSKEQPAPFFRSMRAIALAGFLVALPAVGQSMQAAPQQRLIAQNPAGTWQFSTTDAACSARRAYVQNGETIFFTMTRTAQFDQLEIRLTGASIRPLNTTASALIAIGTGPPMIWAHALSWRVRDSRVHANQFTFNYAANQTELRAAQSLTISIGDGNDIAFGLTQMAEALDHIDQCHETLLNNLGVDVATLRELRRAPQPQAMDQWINAEGRPSFGGIATINLLIHVSETGSVTDCRVIGSTGLARIDDWVCGEIVSRARFTPAVDANGNAVAAPVIQRFRFVGD